MSIIKRIASCLLLINLQIFWGAFTQEDLEKLIEEHKDSIGVLRTSFGFPECIILKTEEGKKVWEDFLHFMGNADVLRSEESIHGSWSVPIKRTPEKIRECFLKYSRKASDEELALVSEYGVKYLRIIDCNSIVNALDEGLRQEFLRVKEKAEAYKSAQALVWWGMGSEEELEKAKTDLFDFLDFWWFGKLRINNTYRLSVYSCGKLTDRDFNRRDEYLSLEGSFSCSMNSETFENFKKELRETALELITNSLIGDYPPYYNAELLVLSLVILEYMDFSADYIYDARNLMERFNLMLDQKPYRVFVNSDEFRRITDDMPSRRRDILYRFLIFTLYERLGIMWNYSLVGNLDLPLERGLLGFLKVPSGSTEPIQVPCDVRQLWFGLDEATPEPMEMEPQRFYTLAQISVLHGGPENIWAGIGFADIDGCIYVNRTIVGKLDKFGIPAPEIHNAPGLLKSMNHWPIFSKDIYDFVINATPRVFYEIAEKFDKRLFETKPWRRPPVLVAGKLLPAPVTESLREICKPWSIWLQLLSGCGRSKDWQREVKLLKPFMDKYLMFYAEQ